MFSYFGLSTEIFICLQVLYVLVIGVILNEKILRLKYKFNIVKWMSLFSILVLFYAMIVLWNTFYYEALLLNYQLITDNLSFFFKFFVLFMSFLTLLLSLDYTQYENIKAYEYILLLLLSIIGILTIISSYDLITMYLSIELQSLCFYIVTNIKFYSNFSVEAGLKYFILGALSSGILLFGASILYGFTGLTNFSDLMILFYYYNINLYDYYYYKFSLIGIIFIYCGLLFKIGIVPFHMWISDIYEGSPTNITLFFAVVPQISIITLLIRLNTIFLYPYFEYLYIFFMILSMLTITIGTFGAIYQTKLKRLFAYSSISNMGYLLSLLCSLNVESSFAIIFYIVVYNLISLGLWTMLLTFRNRSNLYKFKDVKDLVLLFNSNKYLSIFFFIFLFSGMGIPPMLGFFSKLYLFMNIIELKMYFFMLYLIIINSIGSIYYLRLIKVMFSYKTDKQLFLEDPGEWRIYIVILLIYINIYFFLYPSHLIIFFHNLLLYLFY